MATLKNVITELDKLFAVLNLRYFNNELVKPVIIVQSNGKETNVLGHCSTRKIWADLAKMEEYYEISISAEYLYRPFEEIAETLLHECSHLANLQKNIQDCSRGGFYHNKKFKAMCESAGLSVEFTEQYGWAFTKLTDETKKFLETVSVDKDEFKLTRKSLHKLIPLDDGNGGDGGRSDGGEGKEKPTRKGTSYRKHKCGCGLIARTTRDATLICGECGVEMVMEG